MPSYSGVWNLVSVYQAVAQGNWTNDTSIGVFGGGYDGATTINIVEFLSLSSAGNTSDFGDLATGVSGLAACSSSSRGLFGGGYWTNAITYITFASQGNSISFGALTPAYVGGTPASFSNSTRGIWAGGTDPFVFGGRLNVIGYVTIATTGNAIDFGDLSGATLGALDGTSGAASTTRGLVLGGGNDSTATNNIQYVTIATTGNSINFGDLTQAKNALAAAASSTRAVVGGGSSGTFVNVIEYVTIASTGNGTDFGDLTLSTIMLASCANKTNAVFGGGRSTSSNPTNVVEKITIATTGNAVDWGDLSVARRDLAACSNAHGGL